MHPDQAAVHGVRGAGNGALAEKLAVGARGHMILQRPDVVHLRSVAEIRGEDFAASATTIHRNVGTHPVIVAPQADREGADDGVGSPAGSEAGNGPGRVVQDLQGHVGECGALARHQLGHGHHQRTLCVHGPRIHLHHGDARAVTETDARAGKHRSARSSTLSALAPVDDQDRCGDRHTGRHVDEDSVRQERVVEEHQCVAADLGPSDHFRAAGNVVAATEIKDALPLGDPERQRVAVVDHGLRREPADGRCHQLSKDLPFLGQGPRWGHDGSELLELELVDRRVAPDFFAL